MQNGKQAKTKKKNKAINWKLFERTEEELQKDMEYIQLMRTAQSLQLAI